MVDQPAVDRRSVLKATGGIAAGAALGSLGVGPAGASEHVRAVRVNQAGYLPKMTKVAMVVEDHLDTSADQFEVVDASTGSTAYSGSLSSPVDADADVYNRTVRHADFSDLEQEGEYVVQVGGSESFPFEISADVYDEPHRKLGRIYTLKRSGIEIDDPETGMNAGPGHLQDEEAQVAASDDTYNEGDTINAWGGWYDAGDYGKYTCPSAITVGAKLNAVERNPEAFENLDYNFPSGVSEEDSGQMSDALAEIKWKLEWFHRFQRDDGAFFHKVAPSGWPGDCTPPSDQDDATRYAYGLTSAGTAMACANFAQAARVYEDVAPSFADDMLSAALDAWDWLTANEELVFRLDQGQDGGSGPYHRWEDYEDPTRFEDDPYADDSITGDDMERWDRFWAGAELLKTTGEAQYDDYLQSNLSDVFSQKPIDFDWYTGLPLGQLAYYTADAADETRRQEVADTFLSWADERVQHIQDDAFNVSLTWREYTWASVQRAASYGCMLMIANEMDPSREYVDAAMDQLHNTFGRSATNYSYVTTIGDEYPVDPHDRLACSSGVVLPGQVVGGPNVDEIWDLPDNPLGQAGLQEWQVPAEYDPPGYAHYYQDTYDDFRTNEWAINYTAPVFWLTAEARGDWDGDSGTGCPEDAESAEVEGQTVCDLDTDGKYRDVNGDGEVGQDDVVHFFEHQHRDAWKREDLFDFSESGSVGHGDVVSLFETVSL